MLDPVDIASLHRDGTGGHFAFDHPIGVTDPQHDLAALFRSVPLHQNFPRDEDGPVLAMEGFDAPALGLTVLLIDRFAGV